METKLFHLGFQQPKTARLAKSKAQQIAKASPLMDHVGGGGRHKHTLWINFRIDSESRTEQVDRKTQISKGKEFNLNLCSLQFCGILPVGLDTNTHSHNVDLHDRYKDI